MQRERVCVYERETDTEIETERIIERDTEKEIE